MALAHDLPPGGRNVSYEEKAFDVVFHTGNNETHIGSFRAHASCHLFQFQLVGKRKLH